MEAAKGINPEITTTEVTEEIKEIATEVTEEVKEATAGVVEKAPTLASSEKMGPIVLFYTLYAMVAALLLALLFMVV